MILQATISVAVLLKYKIEPDEPKEKKSQCQNNDFRFGRTSWSRPKGYWLKDKNGGKRYMNIKSNLQSTRDINEELIFSTQLPPKLHVYVWLCIEAAILVKINCFRTNRLEKKKTPIFLDNVKFCSNVLSYRVFEKHPSAKRVKYHNNGEHFFNIISFN